jgi:ketosteroid isomerase-like protein
MSDTIDASLSDWSSAECDADVEKLATLLTDDFVGVGPLGFVLPKQAWLARFAGGLHYENVQLEEVRTYPYDDAAVVTARQVVRGTMNGNPLPFEAVRATIVLVRSADGWQMAAFHASFIAGTPGAPPLPVVAGRPGRQ